MSLVTLTPITELTVDNVKQLTIHSTRNSIRRLSVGKNMITIPASDKVPTIYYIEEIDEVTNRHYWSIHALSVEVTKFLLYKSTK